MLVGTVEAGSEHEAIEKAPVRLKQYGRKLTAVRHSSRGFPSVSQRANEKPRTMLGLVEVRELV
jgi:hypothetical protein